MMIKENYKDNKTIVIGIARLIALIYLRCTRKLSFEEGKLVYKTYINKLTLINSIVVPPSNIEYFEEYVLLD